MPNLSAARVQWHCLVYDAKDRLDFLEFSSLGSFSFFIFPKDPEQKNSANELRQCYSLGKFSPSI